MATRTALLNGNVINRDADFSKHIEAVSEPGVISGLAVTSSSVAEGEAFVKCERSNGDVVYALVYNTSAQEISGDGDVYIEVSQEIIDNGELGNEDGSGIAEIKVGTMPATNCLKLAVITSGVVEDKRNMIKKVGELKTMIVDNTVDIADLDTRVEALEEAGAIEELRMSGYVGEKYNWFSSLGESEAMFKQYTPALYWSTIQKNISASQSTTKVHIQRIGSGVATNQLKLKLAKRGSPTQNLKVEVRKGTKVDVNTVEAYWYGDELIASGTVSYSSVSSTWEEITVTLDANFGGTKGELLDVVLYTDSTNGSNYYYIACDSTQSSEAFSLVDYNGSSFTRKYNMPYCVSDGFMSELLCKYNNTDSNITTVSGKTGSGSSPQTVYSGILNKSGYLEYTFQLKCDNSNSNGRLELYINGSLAKYTEVHGTTYQLHRVRTDFLQPGSSYEFKITATTNSAYGDVSNFVLKQEISKSSTKYPKVVLSEDKGIGQFTVGHVFGYQNKSGNFRGGMFVDTKTSATTGNIALGNAVGYVRVLFNGEYIKIPYYSE